MDTFNTHCIKEAQDNLARIKAELRLDTATYWAVQERLSGVYDGDTDAQYDDMMKQFGALSAIDCAHRCIKSISADIKNMEAEDAIHRDAQLDAQGLKHEEWLEASMSAQRDMFNTARAKGVAILAWKDTDFHDEHHYVVMAQNHKLEFVTWSWANGGFHCGHYYNDDEMKAWADYKERT